MRLPLEEGRKRLAEQAEGMAEHYEQEPEQIDTTKIRQEFGWYRVTSFERGMRQKCD